MKLFLYIFLILSLQAANKKRDVKLSWHASTSKDVTSYIISSSASVNGPFVVVGTTKTTNFTVTQSVDTMYYRVVAVSPACAKSLTTPCGDSSPEILKFTI